MGEVADEENRALALLRGDHEGVLVVDASFSPGEGVSLTKGVVVGKLLGEGLQGTVHNLHFEQSRKPTGWVLKVAGKHFLARLMPPMDHEWAIGKYVSQTLGGSFELRGFMRTGAAVVHHGKTCRLTGLILELVNGKTTDQLISECKVLRIEYMRQMLRQVFTSLAAARGQCQFKHRDLRLSNVMEHKPPLELHGSVIDPVAVNEPEPERMSSNKRDFKIIDFGHASLKKRQLTGPGGTRLAALKFTERCYRAFWMSRQDVYRFLMSLVVRIDGAAWLEQDRTAVHDLLALLKQVTGVQCNACFVSCPADAGLKRSQDYWLKRNVLRSRAFWHLKGAQTSAEQALDHEFLRQTNGNNA